MSARTIEVYLPDGEPTGIRIAEVKNRTVQLVAFPRTKLGSDLGIAREGVYFLFGTDEEAGDRPLVYIGQAKDCLQRIRQHHQDPAKDYWNVAAVFVTKDRSFGTTEIEYLEQLAVNTARFAGRFVVKNGNMPPSSTLTASQSSQMDEVFECFGLLLPVIGYPVFSGAASSTTSSDTFYCEGAGVKAQAKYSDTGMVVLKGSQMRKDGTPTLSKGVAFLRSTLMVWDVVKEEDGVYVFVEDYAFTSASTAAQAILGRSENGWRVWKDSQGRSMQEVVRSI